VTSRLSSAVCWRLNCLRSSPHRSSTSIWASSGKRCLAPLTARLRDNRQPPQSRDGCRVATVSSASSIFRWPGQTNGPRPDFRRRPGLRLPSIPSIWTSIWPTTGVRSGDFVGDRFGRVAARRCKITGSAANLRPMPDYINYILSAIHSHGHQLPASADGRHVQSALSRRVRLAVWPVTE
jgi:hypothetical protein